MVMTDLSATLFFKAKFDIAANQEDTDLLWCVVCHIRNWMSYKWKRRQENIPTNNAIWSKWKLGSRISSENDRVRFYSVYHNAGDRGTFWACKIHELLPSRNGCAPRSWTTEVGFQSPVWGRAVISIVIYYSDRPGFIGPCEPPTPASIPNLIRRLCADNCIRCTVDSQRLTLQPTLLKPGDFPEFWEVVSNREREVPVVYISPRATEEGAPANLINPYDLARHILGPNALVYYATDLDFSREMTQMCPKDYGCYSGGIRIYMPQPRIGEEGDQYRHRFIPAQDIRELGAEQICEILRRALAQDVNFYDEMFRVENCQQMRNRRILEERLKTYKRSIEDEFLETTEQAQSVLQARLQKAEEELLTKELEFDEYREKVTDEIKELNRQIHSCQKREEDHQRTLTKERENALKIVQDSTRKYPIEPIEIAEFFIAHFPDRIDFTEKGFASLRSCQTDAEVLWNALYQMSTTLYDLYSSDEVSTIDKEFNQRSSNLRMARGEGKMTRQDHRLMRQYQDTYNGESIDIETHIKTSETRETSKKFLRVYFSFYTHQDPSTNEVIKKIVVGSCGKHLENYTSQKIH